MKKYLESIKQQSSSNESGNPSSNDQNDDSRFYPFLEPALNTISSRYAAMGILEDLDTTMHLFDRTLSIPNFSWTAEIKNMGVANSNHVWKAKEHVALLKLSTNSSVVKFIWLDVILYDHAMNVHKKQVKSYGLAEN